MKNALIKTLAICSLLASSVALAERFNDDYIEVGYTTDNSKFIDNGVVVKGSKELSDGLILKGSYNYTKGDWNDPGEHEVQKRSIYSIELGKKRSISTNTELLIDVGYAYLVNKKTCTPTTGTCGVYSDGGKTSGDYFGLGLEIRHNISNNLNGSVRYIRTEPGSLPIKTNLASIKLAHKITKDKSIVFDYLTNIDVTSFKDYTLSLRYSF